MRGPLIRLARGRSRCASVCVAEQAAPDFYFDVWLKGMVGKGEVGKDEARSNVAHPVASARRDVKGGQWRQ
jgi:hypothetical protein